MRNFKSSDNSAWANNLISQCHQSGDIILQRSRATGMPQWAVGKLYSAYCYIYASMMYEFVIKAEAEIIIDGVRMDDGSVITSRQFLVNHIVGEMIMKLSSANGGDYGAFAKRIKSHLESMLSGGPHA